MPDPISSATAPSPIRLDLERGRPSEAPTRSFAEHLRESPTPAPTSETRRAPPSPAIEALGDAVRSIARGERFVDGAMRRAARGGDLEPGQLLALQAGVYRYTQELELAAKLVDKATGAVKQTLQSQQ